MGILNNAKARVRKFFANLIQGEVEQGLRKQVPVMAQLVAFHNSPLTERQSYYEGQKSALGIKSYYENIKSKIRELRIPIETLSVDLLEFETWLQQFHKVRDYFANTNCHQIEHCLNHFLAYKVLNIRVAESYIDVAAFGTPWAQSLSKLGIEAYRLDKKYRKGIQGFDIGADANDSGLPDSFCEVVSIQSHFSRLEDQRDKLFFKEVERILCPGGRAGLFPIPLEENHFIFTSPFRDQREVKVDPGAKRIWLEDHQDPLTFSRCYSAKSFFDRVYTNLPKKLTGHIIWLENLDQIQSAYKGQSFSNHFSFVVSKSKQLV